MRSGELARLAGVSTDTLRHYERLGLLPKAQRTEGGYRQYTAQSLERGSLDSSCLDHWILAARANSDSQDAKITEKCHATE